MKKILIVDDDESILEALSMAIEMEGFEVAVTPRAEEVENKVREFSPDLILLDVLLAGQDGRQICRQLKNKKETQKIPVILISAHQKAGDSVRESGADDFVAKPFDLEDLIKKLCTHLG